MDGHFAAHARYAQRQQFLRLGGFEIHQLAIGKYIEMPERAHGDALLLAFAQQARALQRVEYILALVGLEHHEIRLHLNGVHGKFRMRRDEYDHDLRPDFAQTARQRDARHARHIDIQQREIHRIAAGVDQRLLRRIEHAHHFKAGHIAAFDFEQVQGKRLIIHQYDLHCCNPLSLMCLG